MGRYNKTIVAASQWQPMHASRQCQGCGIHWPVLADCTFIWRNVEDEGSYAMAGYLCPNCFISLSKISGTNYYYQNVMK